jgi:hypothetical protein
MSFSHTVSISYTTAPGATTSVTNTYTDTGTAGYDNSIPATTTNQEADVGFTQTELISCFLYSTATVTLKTNSTSTPADTIVLTGGQPIIWNSSSGAACPFANNVITKMYITNSTSGAAAVSLRFLTHLK